MLVLSRKQNESLRFHITQAMLTELAADPDGLTMLVTVVEVKHARNGRAVRLGITAPKAVRVSRPGETDDMPVVFDGEQ